MRRLQMGMWHDLSLKDWEVYGMGHLNGLEISQYESEAKLQEVSSFCEKSGLAFGVHTPILKEQYDLPQLAGITEDERSEALQRIEREARLAAKYGADYILFHFPYPPIYPKAKNDEYWTGYPTHHPFFKSEDLDPHAFLQASDSMFEALCEIQARTGQKIVLEYDFFGDFEDIFIGLFKKYPELDLVIDTQRMDIHKRNFFNFDPYQWLEKIAEHVYLAHYSNVRYKDPFERHLPVLKNQCEDPGYGDSFRYLEFLSKRNHRFHVTFEHNPSLVDKDQLLACYDEVAQLLVR